MGEKPRKSQRIGYRLPRTFSYGEVALSNRNNEQRKEMGEDHIFFWDPAVLTLVEGPLGLDPPDGKNWIARAPSWAEFEVAKIWGDGHRLIVVSVHAKSGGDAKTEADVSMIGKAVSKLKEQAVSKLKSQWERDARDGAGAGMRMARCLLKCASPVVA